ncbi:MAG: DUF4097 family beta strand repeat protein [Chloroflexi bacterium]|nr:DUF4097 family beta strand repeat protein [Chloroflexota bacterium]
MNAEERYERTFQVGQRAEFSLVNVRGRIQVRGWDKPEVHITAIKRLGSYLGAQRAYEETWVEMEQSGYRVSARTVMGGRDSIFGWLGVSRTPPEVNYEVQVPVWSQVSIRTVGGPVEVSDISGAVYVKSVSGDVQLANIQGSAIIDAVSGVTTVENLKGNFGAKLVSGDAKLVNCQLSSLWAKAVSANVSVQTSLIPQGSYAVNSVSGDFRLVVPREARCSVRAKTTSGRVYCDLPCQVVEGGRGFWQGVINEGGASVELRSVSGNLFIGGAEIESRPAAEPRMAPPAPAGGPGDTPEMAILRAVERGELTVDQALAELAKLDKA